VGSTYLILLEIYSGVTVPKLCKLVDIDEVIAKTKWVQFF